MKPNKFKLSYSIAAVAILVSMFLVAFFSSRGIFGDPGDSGTVDEVAHIPSGYSYVHYLDYRLNPEHPPLAKALSGASMAMNKNIKGPEEDWSWKEINQWEAGWYMLYESGNNPKEVLNWARIPMILLMIGLGVFLYKWARELFGEKIGLLVLLLYAFYPDVLAHGRLVTTDIAAAFGFVIATYYFERAIAQGSKRNTAFAAIAFAIAQLLKFSSVLLFAVFPILILIKVIMERSETPFWQGIWKNFKIFFWTSAISLVIVIAAYIPFVWNTPPSVEHQVIEMNLTSDPRTLPLRNFEHKFENNKITRAAGHYLLGVMMVVGRVEGGNKTFIMGHLSDKSISWFFPVAWLLKTPITIIVLLFASLGYIILRWPEESRRKWQLSLFLVPIIVYWAVTLKGSLNIGIRHLMPTVPFVLLLIGYLLKDIWEGRKKWLKIGASILILFMIVSTLSYFPGFIGYFNEFTPRDQRYTRMIDSSLDWGQDLLRLKKYIDDNKIEEIKVDYFGGSVPSYYIPQAVEWHSSYGPTTGWLAVSATFYQSSKLVGRMEGKWSYDWLDKQKPEAIIGGSILIFKISDEDLRANPPTSPYIISSFDNQSANSIFSQQKN